MRTTTNENEETACNAGPVEWHTDEEEAPTTQALQAEVVAVRKELEHIAAQMKKLQEYRKTYAADLRYFEDTLRQRQRAECVAGA